MKRGDIGPIGDDIPSIFPIVFGVLLFMGTALYTTQKIDQRDHDLAVSKALLGLSYVVLNQGYVSDAAFSQGCIAQYQDYANRRNVNFLISLKKFCTYVTLNQQQADIFSPSTNYPEPTCDASNPTCIDSSFARTGQVCPNPVPVVASGNKAPAPVSAANPPANFQTLAFPVSVQCNPDGTIQGPGLVNIIVWTK